MAVPPDRAHARYAWVVVELRLAHAALLQEVQSAGCFLIRTLSLGEQLPCLSILLLKQAQRHSPTVVFFALDVVGPVRCFAALLAILQLLPGEDEPLLVRGDTCRPPQ